MIKKMKCKVCGTRLIPNKEKIYIVEEPRSFAETLSKPLIRFSAIDCPRCGCQIKIKPYLDRVSGQKSEEAENK